MCLYAALVACSKSYSTNLTIVNDSPVDVVRCHVQLGRESSSIGAILTKRSVAVVFQFAQMLITSLRAIANDQHLHADLGYVTPRI